MHEHLPYTKSIPGLPKKYTLYLPARETAKVWLTRFELEKTLDVGAEERKNSCREARGTVQGEDALDVWLWGVQDIKDESEKLATLKVGRFFCFYLHDPDDTSRPIH